MKKVITQCEYKRADGQCYHKGCQNVVDEADGTPPVLTPVMALRNHNKDLFHILPVPEFLTWRKNLPVYVVFDKNPTDDKYRAWVPDSCCSGGTIHSTSTIEEVHLRFYPDKDISEVPLIPEILLETVYKEALGGAFSSELTKYLSDKFNILGFGTPTEYEDGLKYRVAAAQHEENVRKKPPIGHIWCPSCQGAGIKDHRGEECTACGGSGYAKVNMKGCD